VPAARIEGDLARLDADAASYLGRVLRLGPGATLEVFDGAGGVFEATIESIEPGAGVLRLGPRTEGVATPRPFVLLQALAKGEKMDLVVQKATELGVTRIVPVAAARSVVRLDPSRAAKRTERWQRIATEAARQCGRADVPDIALPAPIADAVEEIGAQPELATMMALPSESATGLPDFLQANAHRPGHALLVGPEGGIEPDEVSLAERAGFAAVSLGTRILRTETAALAVLAAVRFFQGELG